MQTTGQEYLPIRYPRSMAGISAGHQKDIIEYNDDAWDKSFGLKCYYNCHYVTNTYTGKQFKWEKQNLGQAVEHNPGQKNPAFRGQKKPCKL